MNTLRLLLLPFSLIYWTVTSIRNLLYDSGLLKSHKIPGKSITVGNLSVGGTGKSPLVDYLLNLAIKNNIKVASLSRGYGRTSTGLLTVETNSTSEEAGDEPLLYKLRHGEDITTVVSEDRKKGVEFIQKNEPDNQLIVLDDAFQHRKVKAGLSIVVSDYNRPYYSDFLLPAGNLRESRSGIKRADLLVVSKCPEDIHDEEMNDIRKRVKLAAENVFFSTIEYANLEAINTADQEIKEEVLVVTGIANPKPLIDHLEKQFKVHHLKYKDHYEFKASDIQEIHKKINSFAGRCNTVITTEKDYMRLRTLKEVKNSEFQWMYQPINITIINSKLFESKILGYVNEI